MYSIMVELLIRQNNELNFDAILQVKTIQFKI